MAKRSNKRRTAAKRCRVGKRKTCSGKFKSTLLRLRRLSPNNRRQAMCIANNKFIRDFSNEVKKLRRKNDLKPSVKKQLKRHALRLRKLASNTTSLTAKRKILSQRGGFLPLLLAALPAVGSILGGVISRA